MTGLRPVMRGGTWDVVNSRNRTVARWFVSRAAALAWIDSKEETK